jgi:hypothetical protein
MAQIKSLSSLKKVTSVTPNKNRKFFRSYTDLGNHWLKASISGFSLVRVPSYKTSCLHDTSSFLQGHVLYVDGPRSELIGQCWLVGEQAVRSGSADLMRLVDNYMGKSELYLEYFLGILATLAQVNTEQHHKIIATCNDTKRHEPLIKKLAQGTHQVELRGIPALVTIEIVEVLPEGIAALKNHNLTGNVTICDLGGGNVTITRYADGELASDPLVKDFGCENLLQDLSGNSQLKSIIKQAPQLDTLNASLEVGVKKVKGSTDNQFALYYGKSLIDILPAYKAELNRFIDCRLRDVIKVLDTYKLSGDTILVIGGGAKLPLLNVALKQKGYVISSDGGFDNIKGLLPQ